jgi:hypothetical protein
MATKEAVFSLKVDTGNSVNDIKSFDQAVNSLNKDVNNLQSTVQDGAGTDVFAQKLTELNAKVEAGGLTMREMTQVMKQYQNIAAQAGMESPIGQEAINKASELKDTIGDLKAATTALSSDFKGLDTALAGISTGAAVFQGFESAIALTGAENENLVKSMQKLMAVQGVVNAISEVANNLNSDAILGIQLRTTYEKIYAQVVGNSTGAMKGLKVALAATGVGALVIGLGLLITNFDKVMDSIGGVSQRQKDLNATMDAYKSAATDATMQTNKVKNSFDLAKEGVISKEEALATYNKELGATFGQAKNLNEAEKLFAAKTDAYIQAASLRAQADALMKMAAEERVKSLLADQETERISRSKAANDPYSIVNMTKKNGEATAKEAKNRADDLDKLVKDLTKQAEAVESKNNLASEYDQQAQADADARAKDASDKAKARMEEEIKRERERQLQIIEIRNQLLAEIEAAETAYYDSQLSARDKELQDVNDHYFDLITRAKKEKQDVSILEAAQKQEQDKINEKYDKEDLAKRAEAEQKKLDLIRAYQSVILDEYQNELIDFEKTQEDKYKKLNEAHQSGLISDVEYQAASTKLEEEYSAKIVEINKKKTDAIAENDKKALTTKLETAQKIVDSAQKALDFATELNSAINEIENNRLAAMAAETDAQIAELDKRKEAELKNLNLTEAQKLDIEKKFAAQEYALRVKQFDEEEKIKKRQFQKEKALKMAEIAINTAAAIIKGIGQFGPPPSPLGIAAIASAGVLGIAQAAAVASQKYEGGQAPTMPTFPEAGASTGASASSFAPSMGAQQTSLADYLPGGANGPAVSQVVVLESDITGTQQKVAAQQSLSTY